MRQRFRPRVTFSSLTIVLLVLLLIAALQRRRPESIAGRAITTSPAEPALLRTVTAFELDHVSFNEALRQIAAKWGVHIDVEYDDLKRAGVTSRSISFQGVGVSLDDTLREVCSQIGQGASPTVEYTLTPSGILISTSRRNTAIYARTYDVTDLLSNDRWVPTRETPFDETRGLPSLPPSGLSHHDELRQELLSLIREVIDPDTWHVNGGSNRAGRDLRTSALGRSDDCKPPWHPAVARQPSSAARIGGHG